MSIIAYILWVWEEEGMSSHLKLTILQVNLHAGQLIRISIIGYNIKMNKKRTNRTCWICGALATTREHIVKKRLLNVRYGKKSTPHIYYEDGRIKIAQSTDSVYLKTEKILCKKCNGSLSQPFDTAYDKFTDILKNNQSKISQEGFINLSGLTNMERNDLFRYFAKGFGCKIYNEGKNVPQIIIDMMHGKRYGKNLLLFFFINDVYNHPIFEHSKVDEYTQGNAIVTQFHVAIDWLTYLVCYTNLPSDDIRKKNENLEITPWCGKSKKIIINKY